jgi:catechol 2,3-dioxygenase-like lactoylglutathione lyase family enzyme
MSWSAGYAVAMISHVSLGVAELARAQAFYDRVLGALGYARVWSHPDAAGYGRAGGNDKLALFERDSAGEPLCAGPGFHLAFSAPNRAAVDRFHAEAMAAGARDQGAPGVRADYGDRYYAAFVLDPDGHKLEAVYQ